MITLTGEVNIDQKGKQIQLVAPENTSSKVVLDLNLSKINILVKEGASLYVIALHKSGKSKIIKTSRESNIAKNAQLKWIDYYIGDESIDLTSEENLNAHGAEVDYTSLFFGSKKQKISSVLQINHNAPATSSCVRTHGALNDKSYVNNKVGIQIKPKAKNSKAFQKDQVLLLSKDAKAESLPILEVAEEEVVCSHGASIGRINSEQLFYLMSRGLSEEDAKRQLIIAFFEPVISKLKEKDIICGLRESVIKKLRGKNEN